MKKIFNKSLLHGFLFAMSACFVYYFLFLVYMPCSDFFSQFKWDSYFFGGLMIAHPICYAIISIPLYFILRHRSENKTLFTCSGMLTGDLLQLPLYVIVTVNISDWVTGFLGSDFFLIFFYTLMTPVLAAIFIMCSADLIISMIKRHKASVPAITSVFISSLITASVHIYVYLIFLSRY